MMGEWGEEEEGRQKPQGHDGGRGTGQTGGKGMGGLGVRGASWCLLFQTLLCAFYWAKHDLSGFLWASVSTLSLSGTLHIVIYVIYAFEHLMCQKLGIISTILREALREVMLFYPPTLLSVNEMEIQEVHKLVNVRAKIQSQDCVTRKPCTQQAILCCEKNVANLKVVLIMSNLATPPHPS